MTDKIFGDAGVPPQDPEHALTKYHQDKAAVWERLCLNVMRVWYVVPGPATFGIQEIARKLRDDFGVEFTGDSLLIDVLVELVGRGWLVKKNRDFPGGKCDPGGPFHVIEFTPAKEDEWTPLVRDFLRETQ